MNRYMKFLWLAAAAVWLPHPALAAVNTGDTAWMLMSTALVLLMTPGLALFYAGRVRSKNVVSTLYQNIIALSVVGVLWIVVGYSLAFSGGTEFIGDKAHMMLAGIGQDTVGTGTVPQILLMAFQMMLAIIAPALMTGAFAERVRFRAWIIILSLWSLVVYAPVAHWVWSGTGWLAEKGALDFAGGFVVHMTAGFSALVAAIVLGKRKDFSKTHRPYDIGMVALGVSLMWFGWFGLNAGSALGADGLAAHAFVTTFLAAAVSLLTWTLTDRIVNGKTSMVGGALGAVAGLVAITPAAGYVTVDSAFLIGGLAGIICNMVARIVKGTFKIDDTLDVFACHGVGGMLGVIMTGLLGTTAVNAAGANGLLNGGDKLFMANLTGVVAVALYSMVATYIIIKVVGLIVPVRVTAKAEDTGLDETQHGEKIAA